MVHAPFSARAFHIIILIPGVNLRVCDALEFIVAGSMTLESCQSVEMSELLVVSATVAAVYLQLLHQSVETQTWSVSRRGSMRGPCNTTRPTLHRTNKTTLSGL